MTYSKNEIRYLLANKRFKMGEPRSVNMHPTLLEPRLPPSRRLPLQLRPPSRRPLLQSHPLQTHRLGIPTPSRQPRGGGGRGGCRTRRSARATAAYTVADSAAFGPAGKPVLTDDEYNALRLQLKKDGSSVAPAR